MLPPSPPTDPDAPISSPCFRKHGLASGSSRESFADDVWAPISAVRHIGTRCLGRPLASPISSAIHAVSWTQVTGPRGPLGGFGCLGQCLGGGCARCPVRDAA